jgi:hypothetical protein
MAVFLERYPAASGPAARSPHYGILRQSETRRRATSFVLSPPCGHMSVQFIRAVSRLEERGAEIVG